MPVEVFSRCFLDPFGIGVFYPQAKLRGYFFRKGGAQVNVGSIDVFFVDKMVAAVKVVNDLSILNAIVDSIIVCSDNTTFYTGFQPCIIFQRV